MHTHTENLRSKSDKEGKVMRPPAGLKLSLCKITTVVTFIQLKYEGNIKLVGIG